MKTLTIISHTEHYKNADGTIVGLGSTVTEINHLLEVFDEISHVAMFHHSPAPSSALPYLSSKITFIPLPAVGGTSLKDKMNIVTQAPRILKTIKKTIDKTDYFQFRAPTGIGVFVIPYLILISKKNGWFKYAGNWKQKRPPLAYKFQRWLLKHQGRFVTINGAWPNQSKQCLTFENPCLTADEVAQGELVTNSKTINSKAITFCFVGRLEEEKGLGILIKAITNLNPIEKKHIQAIHIVGQGKSLQQYRDMASESGVHFVFHGYLSRQDVHAIYKEAHAIVLPSASEGFPKVIAEAMNYGCLPIVSNVSSIGHYIKNDVNGYLLESVTTDHVIEKIRVVLNLQDSKYKRLIRSKRAAIRRFTYAHYNFRLRKDVIK